MTKLRTKQRLSRFPNQHGIINGTSKKKLHFFLLKYQPGSFPIQLYYLVVFFSHSKAFIHFRYENQSSDDIFLVAGKYYYLEAIHKGVDASDSLSVGVRMPTGRYQRPIIKQNLQWRLPGLELCFAYE